VDSSISATGVAPRATLSQLPAEAEGRRDTLVLRVAITTLGCKVNRADGDALIGRVNGLVLVPFDHPADVYIINSCTVTATADRQSRQMVHRARRLNPTARIYLTGCLAAVSTEPGLRDELDGIYPAARHAELICELTSLSEGFVEKGRGASRAPLEYGAERATCDRARPFLKVQDGCNHACSYCIVPRARGPSRSTRTPTEIVGDLRRLAADGYREVVLTGIHLGQYGADLTPPVGLSALVGELVDPPVVSRIRLSSVEPLEVTPELIALLRRHPHALCPHLHLPLQSGDDGVLQAMNRPYRMAQIQELLQPLRQVPDLALGTDLIAGFPGETDAQFERTLALVRHGPFTHLHVFPYSRRSDTAAAALPPVASATIKRRARALREAGRRRWQAFATSQVGQVRSVLVEQIRDGQLTGITDNYLRVRFGGDVAPGQGLALVGQLVRVRLDALAGEALIGAMTAPG